jgi:hypothetical protein
MKNDKEMTASYVELSNQAYALVVDAFATANQRVLAYTKSVWEISSRPYASTALETTVRENFDRTNQIVALTISELQTTGNNAAEFAEKAFAHSAKLQETLVQSTRGLVDTGISNMNYAKDTAAKSFDDITKRMDEVQTRTAQQVSHN